MEHEPTIIICPGCQAKLSLKSSSRAVRCPRCQQAIEPDPSPAVPFEPFESGQVAESKTPGEPLTPIPNHRSQPAPWLLVAAAIIAAFALSWWRARIGTAALCMGSVAIVVGIVAYLFALRAIARSLASDLGESHSRSVDANGRYRRTRRRGAIAASAAFAFCLFESLGPREGWIQGTLHERSQRRLVESSALPLAIHERTPSGPAPPITVDPADLEPWRAADLVLIDGRDGAAAVNCGAGKPIRLLAKQTGSPVVQVLRASWEGGRPVIGGRPDLARRVLATSSPGAPINAALTREIRDLLVPPRFVPDSARLVVFHDLRRRQRRAGFLLERTERGLVFADLIPRSGSAVAAPATSLDATTSQARPGGELIPESLIQPGTFRELTGDAALREAVDFVDYCVHRILGTLQTVSAGPVHLFVDQARADRMNLSRAVEELARTEARLDAILDVELPARAQDRASDLLGLLDKLISDRQEQKRIEEQKPERDRRVAAIDAELAQLASEVRVLRAMAGEESRLTTEIRARLSRAGVVLVDSGRALQRARDEAGTAWRPTFQQAADAGLLGASHALLTDIRGPERRGPYQLAMRLVDLRTGAILWEDQGDRFDAAETALELAAPAFLLDAGELSLIEFAGDVAIEMAQSSSVGGFPLRIGAFRLTTNRPETIPEAKAPNPPARRRPPTRPSSNRTDGTRGPALLGYWEPNAADPSKGRFRDLFEARAVDLEEMKIERAAGPGLDVGTSYRRHAVHSALDVPEQHVMRYVCWLLARAVLPLAGQIEAVDGVQIDIALGRDGGLQVADRLTVVRRLPAAAGRSRGPAAVLPLELIVTQVHPDGAVAVLDEASQGLAPPADSLPRPGDLTYRKHEQQPILAVVPPTIELGGIPPSLLRQVKEADLRAMMESVASRLGSLAQAALVDLDVKIVDRESMDRIAAERRIAAEDSRSTAEVGRTIGATHIIVGQIAPDPTQNYRPPASLRVVEVATGKILDRIEFVFSANHMDHWRP